MKVSEARSLDREVVENGLTFAGFAVINELFCILLDVLISAEYSSFRSMGSFR